MQSNVFFAVSQFSAGTPADRLDDAIRNFVTSRPFYYLGVPLVFVILGILAKWLGRRDHETALHRNELAVGTSVFVMTTGKVFSDLCGPNPHVATLFLWAFCLLVCVYGSSGVDRHLSWVRIDGVVTNEKHWWYGIILPDFVALSIFVVYQLTRLNFP